jgi:hypothetical protein
VKLEIETFAPMLAEAFPVGDGEPPSEVIGFYGSNRKIRMIRADYPNRWRLDLRMSEDRAGKLRVTSMSSSLRMVTKPKGKS